MEFKNDMGANSSRVDATNAIKAILPMDWFRELHKRKAYVEPPPPPPPPYDEKLKRVAHALDNATRTGAAFASGTTHHAPFPGLTLRGEKEEVHLPPTLRDLLTIKARATQVSHQETAWQVDAAELEVRNPRWRVFLDECVDAMRAPLGIAPAAQVKPSLDKMLLVEAGGRIPVQVQEDEKETRRRDGVFGRLLIVLPGAFEGGELVMQPLSQADGSTVQPEAVVWRPGARETPYDIAYASFYDHSVLKMEPVGDLGSALLLVYDLVTTTPSEVPVFFGSHVIQQSIDAALNDYFDEPFEPLAKRAKTSPDAESAAKKSSEDRLFVHIVDGKSIECLKDGEQKIAQSLAAFCAQSDGQFVLYHTGVLCSRFWPDDRWESKKGAGALHVTVKEPWIQHNDASEWPYPTMRVKHASNVAPVGRVEELPMRTHGYDVYGSDYQTLANLYGSKNYHKPRIFNTHALVVMPLGIEHRQQTEMPLRKVAARLRELLDRSREDGLNFAKRVVGTSLKWKTNTSDFDEFVNAIVEINDLDLFITLLRHLRTHDANKDAVRDAVAHFGWAACVDTIDDILRVEHQRFSNCINLVCSVVNASSDPSHIDHLLDVLLSLNPWTISDPYFCWVDMLHFDYAADPINFGHVLMLAQASSPKKLIQFVSVKNLQLMAQTIIPALEWLAHESGDLPSLLPTIRVARDLFNSNFRVVDNAQYKDTRLHKHCDKCTELQAFLQSEEMTGFVTMANTEEMFHMRDVLDKAIREPMGVCVNYEGGNRARLKKISVLEHDECEKIKAATIAARETLSKLLGSSNEAHVRR